MLARPDGPLEAGPRGAAFVEVPGWAGGCEARYSLTPLPVRRTGLVEAARFLKEAVALDPGSARRTPSWTVSYGSETRPSPGIVPASGVLNQASKAPDAIPHLETASTPARRPLEESIAELPADGGAGTARASRPGSSWARACTGSEAEGGRESLREASP